ncbi:Stromal membrane-associated [Cryptosporidium sp. chipmunk genotype I]|uniref:Stromal membrane-associated n=1 Tax=Cryptosporidium sp. chipmunk genotype I TaxID=1280935 RepID=UPI00351A52EC|nr:Stromal membrane-associated [Cryptosporidium sp. chipmunk genotype I]
MSRTLDETALLERLRSFQKSCIENRKCANCNEIGPNYVCVDFGTFVCSICSGIHREFNHKVKGISLSKWTFDEIRFICSLGNKKDSLTFLGNRDTNFLGPPPNSNDHVILKEFIRNKYINRIWINQSLYNLYYINLLSIQDPIPKYQNRNSKNPYNNFQTNNNTEYKCKNHNNKNPHVKKSFINRNPFSFIN